MRIFLVCLLLWLPAQGWGQDRRTSLFAAPALVASGVLRHALPRFRLKTGVGVDLADAPEAADVILSAGPEGAPVTQGLGATWRVQLRNDTPPARRLAGWLASEIGQRTFAAYRRDGTAPFAPPAAAPEDTAAPLPEGDLALGKRVARRNCGRCHVVSAENRMQGIGSTPSFAVLRALKDWDERFSTWYVRPPHPGFTQIAGITPPFSPASPPPIVPIEITPEEYQALMAWIARIPPADLGPPLVTR